jgi:nitrite reductase/ring-hydroxylating ferredoxin subunit/uncharacterized membrane protein
MSTDVLRAETADVMEDVGFDLDRTLDEYSGAVQEFLNKVVERGGPPAQQFKGWLNGAWLRHPLHPALTDVPLGAWSAGALLDLVGAKRAADAAYTVGVLGAVPAALSGAADWSDTAGEPRRTGLLHALLNVTGTGLMVSSLVARRGGQRGLGVVLSTLGLSCASVAAWLGGRMVYALGTAVSRTAFEPTVEDFKVVMPTASVPSGQLVKGELDIDGTKVPLVLFKQGATITAISATCTHAGGPLADGKLVDSECVECPWHGSRFSLVDGSVKRGPAVVREPVFEVRIRNGNVEVRRRHL